MMHPKTPKWLRDILDACDLISAASRDQTSESFRHDPILTAAAERKFEIIGEALNRISKVDPATAERIPEYRRIIGFRNVLIHGYDEIEHERLWKIVQSDVPVLHKAVAELLKEAGPLPE
jgi:uncharacterized protein with HEPN domain